MESAAVDTEKKTSAFPHHVCAVTADVPVGHHLLPVIGDGGGKKGGQSIYIFGIGLGRILHKVHGGGQVPGAGAAGQQQCFGCIQFFLELRGLLDILGGDGSLAIAIGRSHGGDLFFDHSRGGKDLGGLFQGGAGDPIFLLGIGSLVQKGQNAVLPLK